MTAYYVWSGASGSNNGSSWANAFTTLTTAFATEVAGDTLYVAHDHAESTAGSVTLTSSGIISNPTKVVCVNRAGSVPPVVADIRATASVTASGANNLSFAGCAIFDGIIFNSGTGASSTANIILATSNHEYLRFDNCSLRLGITAAGSIMYFGGSGGNRYGTYIELNNTTLSFAHTDHETRISNVLRWRNTASALLGTVPTTLFTPFTSQGGLVECVGVDLSAAGSGKTLAAVAGNTSTFKFRFMDCKLNASVTKCGVPVGFGANEIDFVRCGSSGNYTVFKAALAGTLDQETTIVRTGGASDGTTPLSWKIVTSAWSNYVTPFECPPIAIWNDTTGSSVTATIEGIWGGGAVPNDDDVWIEVEYLGDASSPKGSFVNDAKSSILSVAAGQTAGSGTWGGSTTKFKLNVSFTPQQKGYIYARVKCAKTSSTFYIDPLVALT